MSKIYLLRPKMGLPNNNNPWIPYYEKYFAFLVKAKDEIEARLFAHNESGCESSQNLNTWLDDDYSTCEEIYSIAHIEGFIIASYEGMD